MLSKLKKSKFLKNSILYTIGSMMTPLIGFIMLPIYTNYLSPTEYGIMTTIQSLVGMLQVFMVLSLQSAVTRFYYDYMENLGKQKEYLGTIYLFVFIFSTFSATILLLLSREIGNILFSSIPVFPFYYYMVGLSWINALFAIPMSLLRAEERAGTFIMVNIIKSVMITIVSIYLIVVKGLGAESALISQFVISVIVVMYIILKQSKSLKIALNPTYIKNSLIYSLPLIPHIASGWIIKSSDRIILERYVDLEQIGIYALAVQVSMVLTIFYQGLNNALAPRYIKLRKENKVKEAKKLLRVFGSVIIIFGFFSIPIAMYGTSLLSSRAYEGAIMLIPLLICGQIIKGLYYIPVANLFYNKKTKSIAISSTIAALVNILINFTFIPIIGIYGAVISTILAEIIRLLLISRARYKKS